MRAALHHEPVLSNDAAGRTLARRLAPLELSPGVVIAIAVGGAVFTFVALSIAIVVILRVRQRHQLATSNAAGQRRLRRYTRGHLNISENSYGQIPRPRTVLRRSTHVPYRANNGWRAMSSGESLHQKPLLKGLSQVLTADGRQRNRHSPRQSWPLPTHNAFRNAIPLAQIEGSPLSAITERSANNTETTPDLKNLAELPAEKSPRLPLEKILEPHTPDRQSSPHSDIWPTAALKPMPLFHAYEGQRSVERGSQFSAAEHYRSIASVVKPVERSASLEGDRPFPPRTCSRSISLCSQRSGLAPDMPVPPLPIKIPAIARRSRGRINIEESPTRYSGTSYDTASSSVLSDRDSKPFSQTETDQTSIDIASPLMSFRASAGLRIYDSGIGSWEPRAMTSRGSPQRRPMMCGLDQLSAMSSQASLGQHSVNTDQSSGLSMSLGSELDKEVPRRDQPNVSRMESFNQELSSIYGGVFLGTPTPISHVPVGRRHSILGSNPARRLSYRNSIFDIHEDLKSKRASTSALQDVSGNQMSPTRSQTQRRPSSVATTNPRHWDFRIAPHSGPPSALKGGNKFRKGHKRQSCVRISSLAPVILGSTTFPPTAEEPEEPPQTPTPKPRIPGLTLTQPHPLPRPPSVATCNPQITSPSSHKPIRQALALPPESAHSPNSSMIDYYYKTSPNRSRPNSQDDFFATQNNLTTNRSKHLSTTSSGDASSTWSVHGIPQKAISSFPQPPTTSTTLPQQPFEALLDPTSAPQSTTHPRKPAPFSAPPKRPRAFTSSIRGPRSQPSRSPAMKHTSSRSSPGASARDIRKNVLALRRMNSEVRVLSMVGTKKYLRLGSPLDGSPSLWGSEGEGEGSSRKGVGFEKEIERGGAEKEGSEFAHLNVRSTTPQDRVLGLGLGLRVPWGTPGSLYDRDGFLKD
ncbi:MAG: hypothetical protein M1830_000602 [Pleopsidium flavum]|nr:MAG: hypothetical protein M1830_000602 [Pleopsidium flavum]